MAGLSDATIIAAIKALIEGDTDLFNVAKSNTTKLHKVFKEALPAGKTRTRVNYAEISPPNPGESSLQTEIMGGEEVFLRLFNLVFFFKQIRRQNNTRVYNAVNNFREAIDADDALGDTAGIDLSRVIDWGYDLNPPDSGIVAKAFITLGVVTAEVLS